MSWQNKSLKGLYISGVILIDPPFKDFKLYKYYNLSDIAVFPDLKLSNSDNSFMFFSAVEMHKRV